MKRVKGGRLFVAGSINQDILIELDRQPAKGETIAGSSIQYAPGGKGANQAVAAAKIADAKKGKRDKAGKKSKGEKKSEVQMVGAVRDDEFGKRLVASLKSHGVNTKNVQVLRGSAAGSRNSNGGRNDESENPAATGIAVVMVAEADNSIIIVPGANQALVPETARSLKMNEGDVVLAQCEVPQDFSLAVFEKAKSAGAKCILNPAPAEAVDSRLIAAADYLIVNEIELQMICTEHLPVSGHSPPAAKPHSASDPVSQPAAPPETATGEISEENVKLIQPALADIVSHFELEAAICTLGEEGLVAVSRKTVQAPQSPETHTVKLGAIPVKVVDTTGAGDTFCGVFAVSLLRGKDFEASLNLANQAASLAVQSLGGQSADLTSLLD